MSARNQLVVYTLTDCVVGINSHVLWLCLQKLVNKLMPVFISVENATYFI